ncbi:hypothetical protein MACH17_20800 [Phaeobacter inhibens]|uniref:hypothetical protein n=1 Tax=Phaeobacter inhibens TaxID=221822 RepID=UPI002742BB3A|nr:hypothetical protein [Phaeobacter inhibens]GLO70563.1 hypothetical protein MACH17_20800 [Phaeobacter inhibens]
MLTAYVPETTIRDTLTEVFAPQPVPAGYFEHFGPGLTLRRSALRANARQRADLLAEIKMMAPRYSALRLPIEVVHGSADTTVGLDLHARQAGTRCAYAQSHGAGKDRPYAASGRHRYC